MVPENLLHFVPENLLLHLHSIRKSADPANPRDPAIIGVRESDYRTQAGCWPVGLASDYTNEFDWMKFYMNLTRNPQAIAAVTMTQLLNLYASLCNSTNPCSSDAPAWDTVRAQAVATYTGDQATAFANFGIKYGVDRNL